MQKNQLRRHLKSVRVREETDAQIEKSVCSMPEFLRARIVFTYLSFGNEVPTRSIIEAAWDAGKTVVLPRCGDGPREMSWHRVESFDGLARSSFGMEEPPDTDETRIDPLRCTRLDSMAIVPGLCFDELGFRLGYGGGYYDEFLRVFAGTTVGLCRETQMVMRLEDVCAMEPHDLPVQVVVTNLRTIRI